MLEYSGFLQIRHPKSAIRNKKDPLLLCSPNPPPDSYRDGGEGEGGLGWVFHNQCNFYDQASKLRMNPTQKDE